MMKRNILYLVLAVLVPFFMHFSTLAQDKEGGTGDNNTAAEEKRDSEKKEAPANRDARPADSEQAPSLDRGDEDGTAAKEKSIITKKKVDRKKKEIKKQPEKKEIEIKEEAPAEADRSSGDNLLLIDHEKIKYDRIPGITLKKEEPGEDLVKIPDESIANKSKENKKSEGIFGNKTKTIAGWGIVVFIFILFAIYSKTRSKKRRRNTVRTITKR
jgi:hypothetical protein